MSEALSAQVSEVQRKLLRHLRSCPDCNTRGKRCPEAQDMVIEIISLVQEAQS